MTSAPSMLRTLVEGQTPVLALAPMQDVTDLPFWRAIHPYGGADLYFTEYFRVYPGSCLSKTILRSVTETPAGRPVVAQMIGNDSRELVRTALELQEYRVAGIDLNLGCPAPVVYRKCAGGGLLRDLQRVEEILGALRRAVQIPFTVKTRLGFDHADGFSALLTVLARHAPDLVTVHGRTVADLYRSPVRYDLIRTAVDALPCPVLANGNVYSAAQAMEVLERTGARGLMIGRGAIRNPWIFAQIRQRLAGRPVVHPAGRDVLAYVVRLYHAVRPEGIGERAHVAKMKKYMNYIGLGIEPSGAFLHRIRRVTTEREFLQACESFLDHDEPMKLEPFDLGLAETDVMAGVHR